MKKTTFFFLLTILSSTSFAGRLDDAFGSLGNGGTLTDSGTFKSQIRTTHQLGTFNYRFPVKREAINLAYFQSPTLEIGCDGISSILGGVSFINSDQITQLIENIAQASKMYVLQLALNLLCEDCVAELRNVIARINEFTNMAINSCEAAEWAVNQAAGLAGISGADKLPDENGRKAKCGQAKANAGETTQEGSKIYCNTMAKLDDFENWINSFNEDGSEKTAGEEDKSMSENPPNTTWAAMRAIGLIPDLTDVESDAAMRQQKAFDLETKSAFALGELFQSLLGTTLTRPLAQLEDDTGTKSKGAPGVQPPTLGNASVDKTILIDFFLCGSKYIENTGSSDWDKTPQAKEYCSSAFSSISGSGAGPVVSVYTSPIYSCGTREGVGVRDYLDCASLYKIEFQEWLKEDYVKEQFGTGFLFHIEKVLTAAVASIRAGSQAPGYDEASLKRLLEVTPWPLYRALNLVAVFPELEEQMISEQIQHIGLAMTVEYITRIFRAVSGSGRGGYVSPDLMRDLQTKLAKVLANVDQRLVLLEGTTNRSIAMTKKIESINAVMLEQLYNQSILGNASYTRDVGAMLSGYNSTYAN